MSPLRVPNFSPIGARIRVLWRILQSVRKEVELQLLLFTRKKTKKKPQTLAVRIFFFSFFSSGPNGTPFLPHISIEC